MMMRGITTFVLSLAVVLASAACGSSDGSAPQDGDPESEVVRDDETARRLVGLEFVGESSTRIVVGEDHFFSVRARYDDGTNDRLSEYEITTRSAVILIEGSRVRGLQPGMAELTISYEDFELEATVEVLEDGPADFTITQNEIVIDEGESFLVPYTVYDSLGRELEEHPEVYWSVVNSDVVEIDQTGLVTGVSAGRATIEASVDGTDLADTVIVRVSTLLPTGLVIDSNTDPIMIDETYQARVYGVNAGREVTIYDPIEWEAVTPGILQVRVDPDDPSKASIIGVQLGTGDIRVRAGNMQRTLKLEVVPDGWKNTIRYERPCRAGNIEFSYDSMGREVSRNGNYRVSTSYAAGSELAGSQQWDLDRDGSIDIFVELVTSGGRYERAIFRNTSGTELGQVHYSSDSSKHEHVQLVSGNLPFIDYHTWYTDSMGRSVHYRVPRDTYYGSYVFHETVEYDSLGRVKTIRTEGGWTYRYEFTWSSSDPTYAEVDRWTDYNSFGGQFYVDRLGVVRTDQAGNWLYFNVYGEDGLSWDYGCEPAPPRAADGDPQVLPYRGPARWGPRLPRND